MILPLIPAGLAVAGGVYVVDRLRKQDSLNDKMKEERSTWLTLDQQFISLRSDKNRSLDQAPASFQNFDPSTFRRDFSSSLEIQNAHEEPFLSISEIPDPRPQKWKSVHEPKEHPISRLNTLLSAVPNAAVAVNVATTKYMVVQLAQRSVDDLAKAADGSGYRAIVCEGNKIVEQARLFPPNRLKSIVGAGLLWRIASIAVAQKHLMDIDRRLEGIRRRIEKIRAHQENERVSTLWGCMNYCLEVYEDIEHGNISTTASREIESNWRDLLKMTGHLRTDFESTAEEVKQASFGKEFDESRTELDKILQEMFVHIEAKLLCCQLMAIGGEDAKCLGRRLRRIRSDLDSLGDYIGSFFQCVIYALGNEPSFWNLGEPEHSLQALKELRIHGELIKSFEHACDDFRIAQRILEQRKAPAEIQLKVIGGRIEAYSVPGT